MTTHDEAWNYFKGDPQYSDVLKQRLADGVEMDSAKAMGEYLNRLCNGDLRILDFGGGPGHYFPVIRRAYQRGSVTYTSVDIDAGNIEFGRKYFRDEPAVSLQVGSVLEPGSALTDQNCVVSANTLPHVPTIEPLLDCLARAPGIRYFVFRMLIGRECVQIKKHLREHDFGGMFERDFQFNNIYSEAFLKSRLGPGWEVRVESDVYDRTRLESHNVPRQQTDPFYANRVSRSVADMVFKGDVYMPWKFVLGRRLAPP